MTPICGTRTGVVVGAADDQGRVQIQVPSVYGESAVSATPAIYGSLSPAVGDRITVLFESGDPDRPQWLAFVPETPLVNPANVKAVQNDYLQFTGTTNSGSADSLVTANLGSPIGGTSSYITYDTTGFYINYSSPLGVSGLCEIELSVSVPTGTAGQRLGVSCYGNFWREPLVPSGQFQRRWTALSGGNGFLQLAYQTSGVPMQWTLGITMTYVVV